jgi:DNA-binding transcriptional regulator YdaS (Cro superfamily)
METLRTYVMSLSPVERTAFARRCGTTVGYLRKAWYVGNKLGGDLAVAIDRESGGAVRCEVLRPDIDWSYLRRALNRKSRRSPPARVDSSSAGIRL